MPVKEKIGTTVPDPELDDLRSVEVDHPIREPYMPPANERRVVANVIRRFRHYSDIRKDWHEAAVEDLGFYMLKQWKDWEKVELDARGQAPLVPDEIRAAIRNFVAQLTANMPEFRVTGVTDDDVRKAEMFNGIIQFILYNNDFLDKLQEWVKDHGVVGLGAFLVQWNPHGLDGNGRIETPLLSPFDCYPDPESREKDWSDAERIIVSRWIGKNRALLLIPERAAEIRRLLPDSDDDRQFIEQQFHSEEDVKLLDEVLDEDKDHLRYIEEYTRVSQPFFQGVELEGGLLTPELDEKTYKAWKEDTAIADGIESGAITVEETWKIRVRRRVVIGNMLIGEEILPTSHYPVIPLFFEHQRNPYSMGAVRGMKMMQRERNKRRSLMIAYATAATNNKLLIDENAIVDKENIETQWGRPNAVIPIKTISDRPLKDHFWTPTVAPLPSALFTLEQESKQDMADYIGIDRLSRGVSGAAPSTLGATLSIDEFGQRGQIPYVRNIGYALRRMGKVLIDFIQFYMTKPDFIRILNPDRQPSEQAEGFAVNIPQYDTFTEEEIEKINDLSVGKFDIMVVDGSTLPSNRWAKMDMYIRLAEADLIDDIELWKKTDIVDREGLIQRKSQLAQAQQMIQQLQEEVQRLGQMFTREGTKRTTSEQETELEKFKGRLKASEVDTTKMALRIEDLLRQAATPKPTNGSPEKKKSTAKRRK